MADLAPPPMTQDLLASLAAAPATIDTAINPALFSETEVAEKKQEVAEFLAVAELLNLSTIGSHGWPVSHCMHFATYADASSGPVIYMFTQDGTRKLANIAQNPKVAITISPSAPVDCGVGQPHLKLQGLASVVESPEERDIAMQAMFNKVNYEFARYIGLEAQPAIRVDVVNAIWDLGANGSTAGSIDYSASIAAA